MDRPGLPRRTGERRQSTGRLDTGSIGGGQISVRAVTPDIYLLLLRNTSK